MDQQADLPGLRLRPGGQTVVFAVGKPPRPGTVVADVIERLTREGVRVDLRLPHDHPDAPGPLALRFDDPPALVVHRGLRPDALHRVIELAEQGISCCSPPAAALALAHRNQVIERLHRAGVAVPPTMVTSSWAAVAAALGERERIVKAASDSTGRSARVARLDRSDAAAPFPGPWIVQDIVTHDGVDRKLYVTGREVRGLLKPAMFTPDTAPAPATAAASNLRSPVAFRPSDELVAIARSVGSALDLHLYGVDVVVGPAGPVVVDVNEFPGYRGVDGAAQDVTDHVLEHLTRSASSVVHERPGSAVDGHTLMPFSGCELV